MSLSLFVNRPFPPVLPAKRFVGGGPAGVVDGLLNERPEGAGVVDPAGAEVEPPVWAFLELPFTSPAFAPSSGNFEGVCEAPVPPRENLSVPVPKLPNPPLCFLSAEAPFDVLSSPALEVPNPAKLKPIPADLAASPPPDTLLAVDCPAPKSLLLDVAPKLNFGASLDMATTARRPTFPFESGYLLNWHQLQEFGVSQYTWI